MNRADSCDTEIAELVESPVWYRTCTTSVGKDLRSLDPEVGRIHFPRALFIQAEASESPMHCNDA
jgi:hypothetical protein